MRYLILLSLIACGGNEVPCSGEERSFYVYGVIPVCIDEEPALSDNLTTKLVARLVQVVTERPLLRGVYPDMLHFAHEVNGHLGEYSMGVIYLPSFYACGFAIGVGHEWGHLYLDMTTGDEDHFHTRTDIFGRNEGQLSGDVERAVWTMCAEEGLL